MKYNIRQLEAQKILSGDSLYNLLYGGSRSGKTYLLVRNIIFRALKSPNSRHCLLRFAFNHIKQSVVYDTFPKVMKNEFPDVNFKLSKTDWFAKFDNNSEIWFGGLDDKNRTEKILGNEYATIYLIECSQLSWASVGLVITRLAQQCVQVIEGLNNSKLKPKLYFDCNPPNKNHWTYLLFIKHVDPETREPLKNPENYTSCQLNPKDNIQNLNEDYLNTLQSLSPRLRKRFIEGEFADANPNALFSDETIEKWRVLDTPVPQLIRIVVGVDPSGADENSPDSDAIGIVVAGLSIDGNIYVLEDCTVKAGPATWGKMVAACFDRHKADCVVAETNYGGAMVKQVIQTARPRTPFQAVTASRGKHVRAEPFSALYEDGKVRHVGYFRELEEELTGFTNTGYTGNKSPNRADALVWALSALFPSTVNKKQEIKIDFQPSLNYYG